MSPSCIPPLVECAESALDGRGLGLIALAASAWVAVLRRRVQQQTEIIRERLQREAR